LKLYEINFELEKLLNEAIDFDTGEIHEDYIKEIEELELKKDEKILNTGKYIKSLVAFVATLKEEKKRIDGLMKSTNKKIETLDKYLRIFVNLGDKYQDGQCTISTRKTSSVVINDPDSIPDIFKITVSSVNISKTDIADAIKEGEEVEGAEMKVDFKIGIK
jgi:hypothetical protein